MLTDSQKNDIKRILIEHKSIYFNLDINKTLEYFIKRYILSLKKNINISNARAIDCGCGYGWFGFAYLFAGGKHITLVEPDQKRLEVARQIAYILNFNESSISFVNSSIEKLNFNENKFDIFVSIETLEHIGKENIIKSLEKINLLTSKVILLTTPNKLFPVIAHDTRIPLLHWFPIKYRKIITKYLGKENSEHNDFVSPFDLKVFNKKFK